MLLKIANISLAINYSAVYWWENLLSSSKGIIVIYKKDGYRQLNVRQLGMGNLRPNRGMLHGSKENSMLVKRLAACTHLSSTVSQ